MNIFETVFYMCIIFSYGSGRGGGRGGPGGGGGRGGPMRGGPPYGGRNMGGGPGNFFCLSHSIYHLIRKDLNFIVLQLN